jgi:hypothetical protein
VANALQCVVAKVVGLVLALMAVQLLGSTAGGIAVIVLITVLLGPRRTADGRLQVASTAVVALAAMAGGPMGGLVFPVLQTPTGGPRERLRSAIEGALKSLTLPIGREALAESGAWPVYGSLMTDVERLLSDLDYVGAR